MSHWDAMGLGIFAATLSCITFLFSAGFGIEYSDQTSRGLPARGASRMVVLFASIGQLAFFMAWAAIVNAPK